jgi:hypothetical protein
MAYVIRCRPKAKVIAAFGQTLEPFSELSGNLDATANHRMLKLFLGNHQNALCSRVSRKLLGNGMP